MGIPHGEETSEQKTDMTGKLRVRKDEMAAAGAGPMVNPSATNSVGAGRRKEYYEPSEPVKHEPIKWAEDPDRNDPCPCGSGTRSIRTAVGRMRRGEI